METTTPANQTSNRGIADRIVDELVSKGAKAVTIEPVDGGLRFVGWREFGDKGLDGRVGAIETAVIDGLAVEIDRTFVAVGVAS